jgi:hypothetical protein
MATSVSTDTYNSGQSANTLTSNGRGLLRIVGFACLLGFIADMLILIAPPNFGDLQWRVGVLRNLGDRSIVLLIGLAFVLLSSLDIRAMRKQVSRICLGVGLVLTLLSVLAIRDGVQLQKFTMSNITGQATQVQEQIEKLKSDPKVAGKLTPEQIQQAANRLTQQSSTMQQNATTQITKAGASSAANLLITGIATIGIGRYGMHRR